MNSTNTLSAAKKAADWVHNNQTKVEKYLDERVDNSIGIFVFIYDEAKSKIITGPQWVGTFCSLASYASYETFQEKKYLETALLGARYIQSLQIFDPSNQENYGAFREYAPLTKWCYVRDSVSAAWGMAHFYQETKEKRFLTSALYFYDWLLRKGLDKYGYPYWGVILDETGFDFPIPDMNPHLEGVFHGGSLNLFYQLYKATNDKKFVGKEFINLANLVVERIQQPDGSFATFNTNTMKMVEKDPQFNLHIGNDDFNTLGLLCAYDVTKDKRYMDAIEKFIAFALKFFDAKRGFGDQRAALPVILNIMLELEKYNNTPTRFEKEKAAIVELILEFQQHHSNPRIDGALIEIEGDTKVCARSTQYTVIALLKYLNKHHKFLSVTKS